MAEEEVRDVARVAFGSVGALLPVSPETAPLDMQRSGVRSLERAGYRAAWVNEVVGGKDALVQLALLASATDQMAFGTCIANIWAHPAPTMHAAAAQLAEALPGRFLLGLGVGTAAQAATVERDFGRPLLTMRRYLEHMSAPSELPAGGAPYPLLVAANGPKMLDLADEVADGVLPAGAPPEFTNRAREVLGPNKLLVVFVPITDNRNDAATVRSHLNAGADHVIVSVPRGGDFATGVDELVKIAPQLT